MITLVRIFLGFMLVFTALFLILLVLVQRGRGGGLAGALGGMGGQSAFGTKAGDMFTRITVGVAAFWIVLCILAVNLLGRQQSLLSSELGSAAPQAVAPMTPSQTPGQTPAQPGNELQLPVTDAVSKPADGAVPATPAAAAAATPAAEAAPAETPAK